MVGRIDGQARRSNVGLRVSCTQIRGEIKPKNRGKAQKERASHSVNPPEKPQDGAPPGDRPRGRARNLSQIACTFKGLVTRLSRGGLPLDGAMG